jgi:GntR family transcriptional repressor for pyruvate dehydrogenase complex
MDIWGGMKSEEAQVSDQLRRQLVRRIESELLEPGDRLPSERELANLTGVSRTSIRQALYDLERRGYVQRVPRVGTIVAPKDRPDVSENLFGSLTHNERVMKEVMDLREVIEPPIACRAAQRRSNDELEEILAPVRGAEKELLETFPSRERIQQFDVAFHTAIAELTHNTMLTRLMEVTSEWASPSRKISIQTRKRMESSVRAHRRIYRAIVDGDPEQASINMQNHLREISKSINSLVTND